MKKINFIKMQSLGNDFVIIDHIKKSYKLNKNDIKKISDRNYGIGCDQVLILEKSNKKDIAFKYKIYNKDGSESGQCGNGAKCIAKYYFDKYGKYKKEIKIETITNRMVLYNNKNKSYKVDMGIPNFNSKEFISLKRFFIYKGKKYLYKTISIGNPHAVFIFKGIEKINLKHFSGQFNKKKYFKNGVNISLVENIKNNNWLARIYERGSGETKSCGSAACAISVCTKILSNSLLDNSYVHMYGGKAQVKWSGKELDSVYLIGTAEYVFKGTCTI